MEQRSTPVRNKLSAGRVMARDINESLGKLPPQAPDLEEAVLGALMLEKKALLEVGGFLKAEHFYVEAHKIIFTAIIDLTRAGDPVDMLTVVAQLRKNGTLQLVEGAYKIAELTSKVSSAANVEYHARFIMEMAMKRELIELASQVHTEAYEDTSDAIELTGRVQQRFDEITGNYFRGNFELAGQLYFDQMKEIDERMKNKGLVGISSGMIDLDRITHGFRNKDFIVIAGRPGMGKTAIVVTILRNVALDQKTPCAFFSLEMAKGEVLDRLISLEAEVDLTALRTGKLNELEDRKRKENTIELNTAPIYIDDNPTVTITELKARARRLVMQHKVKLIVVDYLQLMHEPGEKIREQEISKISRGLKVMAKELDVPVICCAQLSRDAEKRGGAMRPKLSDLRESGAIEQDADVVAFLYRPEYYKIKQYEDGSPVEGVMEVIIAKHRNGGTGTAKVEFIGKYTKVQNFASQIMSARNEQPPIDFTASSASTDDLPF